MHHPNPTYIDTYSYPLKARLTPSNFFQIPSKSDHIFFNHNILWEPPTTLSISSATPQFFFYVKMSPFKNNLPSSFCEIVFFEFVYFGTQSQEDMPLGILSNNTCGKFLSASYVFDKKIESINLIKIYFFPSSTSITDEHIGMSNEKDLRFECSAMQTLEQ